VSRSPVDSGLERLAADPAPVLGGQRVGLLVHPASVDRDLRHAVELLDGTRGCHLTTLFGPQHGFRGETQDNMVEWQGFRDPASGLPVHSLYGETRRPTAAMLGDLDTLVIDLQDVGARYYTFIWTVLLALEACAEAGKRVVVLDRPNPLGGLEREGPLLDPAYRSFVGMAPLPIRHGLTLGELARLFVRELAIDVELEVVGMRGWRRSMWFDDTGLPWVMPSPNMPTLDTALVYPGFCLLEGTELSEGRGTTRPFELFGAPGIDPPALVRELAAHALPGTRFRPLWFEPTFQKHAGVPCGGAQLHVIDRDAFRPVLTAVTVLSVIRRCWPDVLRWKQPPYEYETVTLPIDILAGGPWLREGIDAGDDPRALLETGRPGVEAFAARVEEYLDDDDA
jgi:uncharacterized protein YbbC (DUF1343 family)